MNREKMKKYSVILLVLFVCMQPVLDLLWLNNGTIPELLGFTLPTLVRIIMIGCIGILFLGVMEFHKKHLWILGYLLAVGIFFVLHHMNCLKFQSVVPGDFNYSLFGELFYIVRMLIPIAVVYFTYHLKFTDKVFEKTILTVSLVMSLEIIVTNILKIGYGTYSELVIDGNIFDWFLHAGNFTSNQLASKGFFYFGISSTILVLLYPYLIYLYMEKRKCLYFVAMLLQGTALFMIGTKATAFSVIIVSVLMALVYLFVTVIKKDFKISIVVCVGMACILALNVVLFKFSPSVTKMNFDTQYAESIDEEEIENMEEEEGTTYELSEDNEKELLRFFKNNYKYISIKEQFLIDSYPYKYDPVFWYRIYDGMVPSERMQNRIVEEKMLQRVKEINNNKMDDWLGIGYTRTSNIYNLEKDFAYQYYSMGIIGAALLVGPYIAIILGIMIFMLMKFKKRVTIFNCSLVLGAGLSCFLAYYSGNVLENLGITIIFGFVLGYLLKKNFVNNSCE